MNTSVAEYLVERLEAEAKALAEHFTDSDLIVDLADGRSISVPMRDYPRLYHGTNEERAHWSIEGEGIHWPDLDEDIRTADLLIGLPSSESQRSLERWLEGRNARV